MGDKQEVRTDPNETIYPPPVQMPGTLYVYLHRQSFPVMKKCIFQFYVYATDKISK